MASGYVTVKRFELVTDLVEERVMELRARSPGYLEAALEQVARTIEDRLRHKYTIPFPPEHPTIERWIVTIVQSRAAIKIGIDPADPMYAEIVRLAQETHAEIAEASNLQSSGWNLPLISAQDSSAISKGAPFGYAESNPYTWTDEQALGGRYG